MTSFPGEQVPRTAFSWGSAREPHPIHRLDAAISRPSTRRPARWNDTPIGGASALRKGTGAPLAFLALANSACHHRPPSSPSAHVERRKIPAIARDGLGSQPLAAVEPEAAGPGPGAA